nr:MAG TPA: repressor protein [Caudoviricetes sp.]
MIYEKVKRICKERKISIFQLERNCGIGNGTIGRWRNSKPNTETIKKVADYLRLSVDELLEEKKVG